MSSSRTLKLDVAVAGIVFTISLLAYLSTMQRSLGWGDASELMIAAYYLGVGHSPGYPTWMLIMYPFAHLPFGTVALRLNFATTLFGALAVTGLFWLFLTITRHRLASLVGALSFAFALSFWDITKEAEVYTLHVTLTAVILLITLWWRRERRDRQLYLLAWIIGISLGNHALTALLIPPILYLVWVEQGRQFFIRRRLALVSAFFILGFAIYLYMPIRGLANPPPHLNSPDSFGRWIYHMSAPGARNVMFDKNPLIMLGKAWNYCRFLQSYEFGWLGVGLGLFGIAALWRRDRRLLWFTMSILLLDLLYASNFNVFDSYVFYLPTHVMWACYIAYGAAHVSTWTGAYLAARVQGATLSPLRQYGAVSAMLLLTPLLLFTLHRDSMGDRDAVDPVAFAHTVMEMAAPNAVIIGDWWHIAPLAYLRDLEGVRPDIRLNSAASLETTERFMPYTDPVFIKHFSAVYFTELLTDRAFTFRDSGCYLVPEGPLWRIYAERPPAQQVLVTVTSPPLVSFAKEVALTRVDLPSKVFNPMGVFSVTFYWTMLPEVTRKFKQVTLFIEDQKQNPVYWQTVPLGHDLYPQHDLKPGQTVREPRAIYLGRPLDPGTYHLLVRVKGRRGSPFTCDRPLPKRDEWTYHVADITVPETTVRN